MQWSQDTFDIDVKFACRKNRNNTICFSYSFVDYFQRDRKFVWHNIFYRLSVDDVISRAMIPTAHATHGCFVW